MVPEDDPANNETMLRLADEVLFLRDQLRQLARAIGRVQERKPIALIGFGVPLGALRLAHTNASGGEGGDEPTAP